MHELRNCQHRRSYRNFHAFFHLLAQYLSRFYCQPVSTFEPETTVVIRVSESLKAVRAMARVFPFSYAATVLKQGRTINVW